MEKAPVHKKEIPIIMKTIGIIGGLGPQATIDFEQQVHYAAQQYLQQFENRGYPPMLTYFLRDPPFKLNHDGTIPSVLTPHSHLLEVAKMLATNADFLVIPSNTPHIFIDEIEKAAGKKVLNMISITIEEIKRRNHRKVGIIAIGHTFRRGLYQKPLEELRIPWEGIDEKTSKRLDKAIFAVMEGRNTQEDAVIAREAVEDLRRKKTDGIILGCSELPLLLKSDVKAKDIINPTELLAKAAVHYAIEG